MSSSGVNGDSYTSIEYCPDCDEDFAVEIQTDRITAETVTTLWICPNGHGHEGEIEHAD